MRAVANITITLKLYIAAAPTLNADQWLYGSTVPGTAVTKHVNNVGAVETGCPVSGSAAQKLTEKIVYDSTYTFNLTQLAATDTIPYR